jgi:hypothetical protein
MPSDCQFPGIVSSDPEQIDPLNRPRKFWTIDADWCVEPFGPTLDLTGKLITYLYWQAPSSPCRLTEVTGSTIAMLNDTCGNLIQITQLARW